MPVEDAPDDDSVRQSYNFAPGYHGLVYRADGPDYGSRNAASHECNSLPGDDGDNVSKAVTATEKHKDPKAVPDTDTKYRLQSMKWGLIPFWTKRKPEYGSMMKTINCRDDSLAEDRGMWTSMKKKKRCIVVAQGFYEWLKKNNGREKIPHFTKRKDGQLMCFAGLWDCVQYEGKRLCRFRGVMMEDEMSVDCPTLLWGPVLAQSHIAESCSPDIFRIVPLTVDGGWERPICYMIYATPTLLTIASYLNYRCLGW